MIFDVFRCFQFKGFLDDNGNENLLLFGGSRFERPTLEDLERIKLTAENSIKNYNEYCKKIDAVNDEMNKDSEEYLKKTQESKKPKLGTIYVAKCNFTGYYRIGFTKVKISDVIKQLKQSNPKVILYKSFDLKNSIIEKKLQGIFYSKNVTGKWFKLDNADLSYLETFISEYDE